MGTKTIELKVGVFILIGITIFFIIVFSISDIYFIKPGYRINILFNFASGLARSAPVRLAGVNVGQVETIDITYDKESLRSKAFVRAWIKGGTNIEEDSEITINTLGLLGEKYLEITAGSRETRRLGEGDILRGSDPVSTEELTRETKRLIGKLDAAVESVNKIVGDDQLREDLKDTVSNLNSLSAELNEFVSTAKNGKGTIGRLMTDDTLYKDMDELILDIKQHPWKLLYRPKEGGNK